MRVFLLLVATGLIFFAIFKGGSLYRALQVSGGLVKDTVAYKTEGDPWGRSMLVLGDSTAMGVGASKPEDSVAGRLATAENITHVENYAEAGATVADLEAQAASAQRKHYNIILVQIGANDIIRFHDEHEVGEKLAPILKAAIASSDKAYLMMVSDVGAAPIFPWPLSLWYNQASLRYHDVFKALAGKEGVIYVSLYEPPKTSPFVREPNVYLARDSFHPSSEGYRLWYEKLTQSF